ncbi:MAG: 2-C-methyl-D-erythritol 4-phosphate cytidylyltransferase [Desulfobulbaceae bacterium]|nr:2-C-methyl-D-erythritol 4-phosphate cytidylyltransferase [Desulfobulbaceae bacterium]
MATTAVIIPAGGVGLRMGAACPKQFLALAGVPVLARTVRIFRRLPECHPIVVVAPAAHLEATRAMLARFVPDQAVTVVPGGETRQDSVRAGLAALPPEVNLVVVHDGVRPLLAPELVRACLAAAAETGAALLAVPVRDTVKESRDDATVAGTVARQHLWLAQTPQVARKDLLLEAFAAAERDGYVGTDEASLLERIGREVRLLPGSERNLKITRPEDLALATALLGEETGGAGSGMRIGHGYDAHRFAEGRRLVLGGVEIAFERGLLGHSDADVLLHALCDAMLGAAGLGDLGRHFPDQDPAYKGISSLVLLERVVALLSGRGLRLVNVDVTVIAQRPKLAGYFPAMQENIARTCRLNCDRINLKATTTEKMGFAGREEGIAAHAVALLNQCEVN